MFAVILKKLRNGRNLSQKQFAQEIYISPSAISQYETGRTMPSRENLDRIARFFDVSTDYLLGSSAIAEKEEQLNQKYCGNITVSELIDKCIGISDKYRETLLDIVDALQKCSESQDG